MNSRKKWSNILAAFLSVILLITIIPMSAFAGETEGTEQIIQEENIEGVDTEKPDPAGVNAAEGGGVLSGLSAEDSGDSITLTSDTVEDRKEKTGDTATVSAEKCKVTFDLGGHGSPVDPIYVEKNIKLTRPADPKAEGFVFAGWYTDKSFQVAWDFNSTTVVKDMILYAKWTEEESLTTTDTEKTPDTVPQETVNNDAQPQADMLDEKPMMMLAEAGPLRANDSLTCTITFDSKGGSKVPAQTIERNTAVTEPDKPAKDGWYFGGWFTDEACTKKYVFRTPVTGDLTLYAGWYVVVSYDSYDTPDGTLSKDSKVKFNDKEPWGTAMYSAYEGAEVSLEAQPADGKRFVGWVDSEIDAKDPSKVFSTENPIKFACSLDAFKVFGNKFYGDLGINAYRAVALFEKIPSYTVTYKIENGTWADGTTTDGTETVNEGSNPAQVPAGMKAGDGYRGGKWDTDPGTARISADTTFTYTFEKIPTYTVTYKVVNGTWADGSATDKTEIIPDGGSPAHVPAGMIPAKNYDGGAWSPNPNGASIKENTIFTYTFTTTPVPVKESTLTFDLAGGTLNGKTGRITISAKDGDTIKLPEAPAREGYTFQHWKGSEYAAGAEYKVEGDHTFTAEWEVNGKETEPVKTYTVTFNTNGHGTAPVSLTVEEGKKAAKPADPKASDYTFGGWFTDKECKNAYSFDTAVTKNITLYAKWTKNSSSSGGTSGSSSTSGKTAAKTGDESQTGVWVLLMAASLLLLLLITQKRKDVSR